MADKKKKKGVWDSVAGAYQDAAKKGYLGAKAKVAVEENEKKKQKK